MNAVRITAISLAAVAFFAGCAVEDDTANESSPAAETVATPLADSQEPAATAIVQSYDAQTLDGQSITIRAGDGALSSFTEDVPSEMYSIRLLAEQGDCDQIQSTGDLWASLADDTDEGTKASAFAKFAYDVHAFIQCPAQGQPVAAPAPAPEPATDPRFGTCREAIANGYGNYQRGVDPEYDWYRDGEGDGLVCET